MCVCDLCQNLGYLVRPSLRMRVCQIQHTMQLIKPILAGAVRSIAVREEASAKYNSWMQRRLTRTVWNFCDSYYRRETTNGKIFATFPGPVSLFWLLARRPRYSDYEIIGGERWRRREGLRRIVGGALKIAVVIMALYALGGKLIWGI